jgi:hypothetical protein
VLSSGCLMLYYMHDVQLFLWPQCIPHREHGPSQCLSQAWHLLEIPFCIHVLGYCHLLSTWVGYWWLLWVLLPCFTQLHTPSVLCNVDANFILGHNIHMLMHGLCLWSFLYPYSKATEVLPFGNAVLYYRPSAQLFMWPDAVHHSLSQLYNLFLWPLVDMLSSGCTVMCCMLGAQLFLQREHVPHWQHKTWQHWLLWQPGCGLLNH